MSNTSSGQKASVEQDSDREAGMGNTSSAPVTKGEDEGSREMTIDGTHEQGPATTGKALNVLGTDAIPKDKSEEVERLRAAMNAQIQLNQHREKLAQQLGEREGKFNASTTTTAGKNRVSPIHEETVSPSLEAAFASPLPSGMETSSTESTHTVRGGMTPAAVLRTPSYPFPPMRTPSMQMSFSGHRPFTALSPTVNPSNFAGGLFETGGPHDRVMSGSVTPASTLNFQPSGTYQSRYDDPNFPSPNLYDMALMLSAEPGLDPWWTTVCQLMKDSYKAERVTLSVPADSTDLENVPWGQKATFNANEEDELSLTYLPRGSSLIPSSGGTNDTSSNSDGNNTGDGESPPMSGAQLEPTRPGLLSRHSFTSFEDTKRQPLSVPESSRAAAAAPSSSSRPATLLRSQSYLSSKRSSVPPRTSTLQNAELNLQSLQDHAANEAEKPSATWDNMESSSREIRGRVFPVMQALDYEADPLIDSSGIIRVLERGKVVALTRDYPYFQNQDEQSGGSKSTQSAKSVKSSPKEKAKKGKAPEMGSRISSFLSGQSSSRRSSRSTRTLASEKGKGFHSNSRDAVDEAAPSALPIYEEYEQAPPSPWSQSPAPSPAVRVETSDNPFFARTSAVKEDTFDPSEAPQDYSATQPVEAIGIDRSWTVLHIPLAHPLLSKPVQSFRLDAAAMELRTASRNKTSSQSTSNQESTKHTNSEPAQEKRTPIAILSILSPIIPYPSSLRHSLENLAPHLATSFSLCRHFTNLETEVAGLTRKRPQTAGFGAVASSSRPADQKPARNRIMYSPTEDDGPHQPTAGSITSPSDYSGVSRSNNGSSPSGTPGWDPSVVGLTPIEKRAGGSSPTYSAGDGYFSSKTRPGLPRVNTVGSSSSITGARRASRENSPADTRSQQDIDPEQLGQPKNAGRGSEDHAQMSKLNSTLQESGIQPEAGLQSKRQNNRTIPTQSAAKIERTHTQLHSYGADFGSTFQSLPTTSVPTAKTPGQRNHSRSSSITGPTDMPPPSDRLKGLMLDSLPAHVFVALPQTGEIVWVNSRYLTYRGQSVSELYQDPWASIHPEERESYLKSWTHAVKTGEQFSMQVRIKRFDGNYRWFYTRAVGSRDTRGVIVQWYGSHMDIHDQHIAEVKAARQEEIEASEAKHRQLANLIPQTIFAATEDEGVTFANEQWLSYTGQSFEDALGLGFMDFVHPEDLAKCRIPVDRPPTPSQPRRQKPSDSSRAPSQSSSGGASNVSDAPTETTVKGMHQSLSRSNSSTSGSIYEMSSADLSELAKTGVIKVTTDSDGRLSYTTEVRLRSKTGEYRWHLVRCVEVDNINLGSGDGSWFGACTDINDHKLLETKLKEAMDSKSRFLSNMSHEIRTPLIGISGMVNFLQDTTLNDEQLDYTNTIQSSATNLLDIINDILDLSKVDAGMMKLSYEWFHTRSLVEEVNELVSSMAITKRLELNYVVDVDVPEMVKGDKVRIRQVLLNVIGNAIKFTAAGEVFSRCRVYHDGTSSLGEDQVMLEYSIIDTGSGFTQEEADLIFKPFSQIDGSSTRQHGGSGLGLVISRQLVELHGGKMVGSAVPGEGSTFTFTARFGLPTGEDYPEPLATPHILATRLPSTQSSTSSSISTDVTQPRSLSGKPIMPGTMVQSPATQSESSAGSPAVASSGSSVPSLRSSRSHATGRTSVSSLSQGVAKTFEDAARASGSDASQMKLALPVRTASGSSAPEHGDTKATPYSITMHGDSSGDTIKGARSVPTAGLLSPGGSSMDSLSRQSSGSSSGLKHLRPPMYSILLICPQKHSREATTQHIEITLPKDVPHQITPISNITEAQAMIGGEDPVVFTHIVLNLPSAEEIVTLVDQIFSAVSLPHTSVVVLSDPVQRQEVIKLASDYDYDQLAKDNRVNFIYKPVKPSRFAVIFDPDKERDLSIDRNRSSAQQHVANQKQNYLDVEKRLGNKGLKVLLVEDNLVNQKVLLKFLSKVGIAVELALDGSECTDKVFSHPHSFYSIILCDLHMPRKDGYQTCREIRQWEEAEGYSKMPIIALSANVMADVLEKCVSAGFNSYVTKPVDFKALSNAMSNLLDTSGP
ncbi:hsp90-like protein [Phlyctema vagabunda]|uniref:histidine kinase n=1 Tax=Phlyctema vagabunda TaxID=108571 RepID=A0ABR4PXW0_9HELO